MALLVSLQLAKSVSVYMSIFTRPLFSRGFFISTPCVAVPFRYLTYESNQSPAIELGRLFETSREYLHISLNIFSIRSDV